MKAAFRIARHEIRQVLREPKFWIPFLIPPTLLICTQFAFLSGTLNGDVVPFTMLVCALLLSSMVVPLASDSFAGERERGSLELLQLLPTDPASVFCGKLLALLPVPFAFLLLAETIFAFAFQIDFSIWLLVSWAGICFTILFSFIALLVSFCVKTARAANQISLLFFFGFFVVLYFFAPLYLAGGVLSAAIFGGIVLLLSFLLGIPAFRKFRSG